jgi:outer membrane biosynthesis protein TonB
MAGLIVVIALFAMLMAWQDYAQRTDRPTVQTTLTKPLMELLGASLAMPTKAPEVKMANEAERRHTPHTGGAPRPQDQKTGSAVTLTAPPKMEPPARVQQSELAPNDDPISVVIEPNAVATPEAQPVPPARSSETPAPDAQQAAADNTARLPTPERPPQPPPAAEASAASMQPGVPIAGGLQAPALYIMMSAREIEALLANNKAVVVVVDEAGNEPYVLVHPEKNFRPFKQLSTAVSERYVLITDPGLQAQWRVRLSVAGNVKFALRFTQAFDKTVVERQFASLAAHNVNFERAVAEGAMVITHARVDAESANVMIHHVTVQKPIGDR